MTDPLASTQDIINAQQQTRRVQQARGHILAKTLAVMDKLADPRGLFKRKGL